MEPLFILKTAIAAPLRDQAWDAAVPKMMRNRSPRIWNLAYSAVAGLLAGCQAPPASIVTATALGALDETRNFLDGVFKDGFGSPRNFIASVHNSMAGKIALDFKIRGPNLTVCDGHNSFASALKTASLLNGNDYPVLLLVIDEHIPLLDTLQPNLSDHCREYLAADWEEAAVAFLLTPKPWPGVPSILASGPSPVGDENPEEKIARIIESSRYPGADCKPLAATSDSFIKPALAAYDLIIAAQKGVHAIGSYSPATRAAAVITVCM
jgi:hypothetical protein